MGVAIGRKSDIGIAKEVVRATALDPTFWIPQTNLTFDEQIEQVIDESSIGVIEDSIDANVTEKFAMGTLEGRIQAESFGLILLAALGAVGTSLDSPEAGVNTHVFSVLQAAQHPSLTIGLKEENSSKRYALGKIRERESGEGLDECDVVKVSMRGFALGCGGLNRDVC